MVDGDGRDRAEREADREVPQRQRAELVCTVVVAAVVALAERDEWCALHRRHPFRAQRHDSVMDAASWRAMKSAMADSEILNWPRGPSVVRVEAIEPE